MFLNSVIFACCLALLIKIKAEGFNLSSILQTLKEEANINLNLQSNSVYFLDREFLFQGNFIINGKNTDLTFRPSFFVTSLLSFTNNQIITFDNISFSYENFQNNGLAPIINLKNTGHITFQVKKNTSLIIYLFFLEMQISTIYNQSILYL